MGLTAIFRTHPGESLRERPAYHSKLLTLQSFLLAWRRLDRRRLVVVVDGKSMPAEYTELYERYADEIRYLGGGSGNNGTYKATFPLLGGIGDDELVFQAEDDYLYMEDALTELVAAAAEIPQADYFCPYDHPDRYTRKDDARSGRERIFFAGNRHWRSIESNCLSFGARAGVLKKDLYIHRLFSLPRSPRDRKIWRMTQGIGPFFWKSPKRTLISPMPSLSTHMDAAFMAPGVDWEAQADLLRQRSQVL
jgi:hypothetical protein